MRRSFAALFLLVGSLGVVAQGEITPVAGQQDASPHAGRKADLAGNPCPGAELEEVEGRIPRDELGTLADPGSRLGLLIQAGLPAGVTLSQGVATPVMSDPADAGAAKWFVLYPLTYHGVPISKCSDAFGVVSAKGNMQYIRKRSVPLSVDAREPIVPAETAIAVTRQRAQEDFGPVDLQVSPPELEVWVEPSLVGRLAWTLTIRSTSRTDPKARRYWVAAVGQPQVLQAENLISFGHSGTVSGTIWEASPFKPFSTSKRPVSEVEVTRVPGGTMQVAGLDGRYSYLDGGGMATITSTLAGPRCVVNNEAGAEMVAKGSGVSGSPIDLIFLALPSEELKLAQASAYFWTNATYQFARSILDRLPPALVAKLPVNVNLAGACSAFFESEPLSINFFVAGCICPNTAYSDVVAHEYGHAVDYWHGGKSDNPYSEGFSDAIALLLTRQSCYGRDFFGPGTCFREANAVDMWPPDVFNEDDHAQGKRYAQFVWQLVQQLQKTFSEAESFRLARSLVLAAAASDPSNIPDAVKLSFVADDTDGKLANGTPHCRELVAAAESRKIPVPASLPVGGRCRARLLG